MAMSGYTLIDSTDTIKPPFHLLPDQTTVLDWLASKGKRFEIYVDARPIADVGPPSNLLLMKSQWKHVLSHGHALDELQDDWQGAGPAPDVIYCEPFYNDFATAIGQHGNCNHPPLPLAYGEDFLERVYETLTSNPAKWAKTMLVVCYDEHGGFFDHVTPPAQPYAMPQGGGWLDKTPFATLGVRVPGLIVSPLVESASCFNGLLDHTSILQLVVDRFGAPADLAFFRDAGARKGAGIQSLAATLTRNAPRTDIPAVPDAPRLAVGATGTTPAITDLARMFRAIMADRPARAGG
jgi:phospholipase C